jgi:hypothetical protein
VSTEPIIFETDEEVEFWKATYIKAIGIPAADWADEAVRELRARMPAAQSQPTYPPGEEPRVVQVHSGNWDIVRGPHSKAGDYWSHNRWRKNAGFCGGAYGVEDNAREVFASLTPAQLAAPVGVEVK